MEGSMAEQDDDSAAGWPIAIVMLDQTEFPDRDQLFAAIRRRIPSIVDSFPDSKEGASGLIVAADGKRCVAGYYPEPYPLEPDDQCIKSAWWWREARADLQHHRAYVAVAVVDEDGPVHRFATMAAVAAAVIETSSAIGVLWVPAEAVWRADKFREEVDSLSGELPVGSCVSVKLIGERDGDRRTYCGFTCGLAAFDLMEIEVRDFKGPAMKMIETILDMASYLIKSGPIIEHGQTIGHVGEGRFDVYHQPSTYVEGRMVYRLYLDADEDI